MLSVEGRSTGRIPEDCCHFEGIWSPTRTHRGLEQNSRHLGGTELGSDHPCRMQQPFTWAGPWMVGCRDVVEKQETKKF